MSIREMWVYGDSLSNGNHGKNAYYDRLTEALGIEKIRNFAVGSSGLSAGTPNSMVSILARQTAEHFAGESAPEIILAWHGSNDWYWGTPIETYRADVLSVTRTLREHYPAALVIWATPIFRLENPDGMIRVADAFENPNKIGRVLGDYVDALRDCATVGHFPLIEMGQSVNIHLSNEGQCLEDHVHPNEEGYRRIANVLIREIQAYWELVK